MSGHSIIPPSSAHIWGKPDGCTGWVMMAQRYPEPEDSPQAREGTAAHELAALMVDANAHNGTGYPKYEETVGGQASNGETYTAEMYEAGELYAEDALAVMRKAGVFGGDSFFLERKVHAGQIHALSEGTVDLAIFNAKTWELFVWDYKFGRRSVQAFENWQLINYTAGIFNAMGIDSLSDLNVRVHFRIVQPRAFQGGGPIRTWSAQGSDLRAHFNVLANNAEEALSNKARLRTGDQCRDCSGRANCPAALEAGLGLYEVARQVVPQELDNAALGLQLAIVKRAKKQLEYLEEGFTEQVKSRVRAGAQIPGWTLTESTGRQVWAKPIGEVIKMGQLLNVELAKPEAITPKKAMEAGVPENMVTAYSKHNNNGLKLAADDGTKARSIFTNYEDV